MKKLLLLACALCIFSTTVNATEQNVNIKDGTKNNQPNIERKAPTKEQIEQHRKMREAAFDKKLGLTDEQKTKAKELRKSSYEKIKPVMDEIRDKQQKARAVRLSRIAVVDQEKQLNELHKDIKKLEQEAAKIRKQNMKEFESILTKEQKTILKQMKKDGRKNFHKEHKQMK